MKYGWIIQFETSHFSTWQITRSWSVLVSRSKMKPKHSVAIFAFLGTVQNRMAAKKLSFLVPSRENQKQKRVLPENAQS